jgi:hypothetical protein
VLDLVVPDLQLPHASAELDILLVLVGLFIHGLTRFSTVVETRGGKTSLCSQISCFFQFSECRMRLHSLKSVHMGIFWDAEHKIH